MKRFLAAIALVALCFSCKEKSAEENTQLAKEQYSIEKNSVDTIHLRKQQFSRETISNGVLKGVKRAQLRFSTPGEVAAVAVKNGTRVKKGDIIAKLDTQSLELDCQRAQQSLGKAQLDLYDALIGFGYGRDTSSVPADIFNVAKIRSGYASALNSYKIARLALQNATLLAPHNGVVANLAVKEHEYSQETVCTIIDDSAFDVEFKVLEGELPYIAVGREITLQPFIDVARSYSGTIKEINPFVDEKGQIAITAAIKNTGGNLMEGMNVKVFIKSTAQNLTAVPKSAVVMRDGYDVLFVFNPQSGKAEWRYVDVLQSNSTHHVVRGHQVKNSSLSEGEAIIISGNLNLADGSDVEIRSK